MPEYSYGAVTYIQDAPPTPEQLAGFSDTAPLSVPFITDTPDYSVTGVFVNTEGQLVFVDNEGVPHTLWHSAALDTIAVVSVAGPYDGLTEGFYQDTTSGCIWYYNGVPPV